MDHLLQGRADVSDEADTPPWETIIRLAFHGFMRQHYTSLPGVIVSYDKTKSVASARALLRDIVIERDGVRRTVEIPEIHTVPVMHFGPAEGRITVPVKAGSPCALWFSSACLDQWLFSRSTTKAVDPKDSRRQDINDAFAMVGLYSPSTAPYESPDDAVVIHCGVGVKAKIGGPTGTERTIMADTWETGFGNVIGAIVTALNGIAPGSGAAVTTAWNAFKSTTYKTSKTEVK